MLKSNTSVVHHGIKIHSQESIGVARLTQPLGRCDIPADHLLLAIAAIAFRMRATPRCNPLDDYRYALCRIRGSLGGHAFANGARADEKQAVKDVLYAYEAAWSRPDARAIAGFYFRPAMRASRTGAKVRSTRAEQEKIFRPFLPSLGRTVPRECFNLQKYGGESQRSIGRSYGAVYVTQQCHAVEHIVKAFSRRHALR